MWSEQPLQRDEAKANPALAWLFDALASAGAGAWSWDAATGHVEWAAGPVPAFASAPRTLEAIDELVQEDDRALRRAILSRAFSRGEPWVCTFRLARGPEVSWMEERGRVWLDSERGPVRAVALVFDVTARKQAKDSLEGALEREDRERATAEAATGLAEAGLRELQEQREDMARMISHDLRTPLGVILAQAKLLGRRNEGSSSVRARGEAIAASAQRMAAMLNDLVESALLEAGKLRLELEPLDVVEMLRDLRVRLAAPFHGERIRVDAPERVPAVLADPNRIERVLVNLLTNALKYSKPASEVVVRARADAGSLFLEVEDCGQGIAPEDLPHVFERYYRALGSSRLEGMGLGLYTARMLVEAHGGTIGAASAPGKGSVFQVTLPLRPPGA